MKIHQGLANFPKLDYAVVTSGTFDGVHLGHQKILKKLIDTAKNEQGETVLITFFPHPRMVLSKNKIELLSTIDERGRLLKGLGINHLLIIPFTKEFAELSPDDFIQKVYVDTIQTKRLIIGYDHHFGKNREGNFNYLKKHQDQYNFEVEEIAREDIDDIGISSTKIRIALKDGNITLANTYLGKPYSLEGKVMHGDKIGRQIGFPTANIHIKEDYKLIPKDAIYAVEVFVRDTTYKGMLYIGNRPSITDKTSQKRIEVNIFNFNENIYEQEIRVELLKKIREDITFASVEELTKQLKDDERVTRAYFQI